MERIVNHNAYSDLCLELKDKREKVNAWLVANIPYFAEENSQYMVDPEVFRIKLEDRIRLDKQIQELEGKILN